MLIIKQINQRLLSFFSPSTFLLLRIFCFYLSNIILKVTILLTVPEYIFWLLYPPLQISIYDHHPHSEKQEGLSTHPSRCSFTHRGEGRSWVFTLWRDARLVRRSGAIVGRVGSRVAAVQGGVAGLAVAWLGLAIRRGHWSVLVYIHPQFIPKSGQS